MYIAITQTYKVLIVIRNFRAVREDSVKILLTLLYFCIMNKVYYIKQAMEDLSRILPLTEFV